MPLQVSKHGLGFIVSFRSHLDPATAVACNGAILSFSGNTENDVFLAALFVAEYFNPVTPIGDQDRISPYIINTMLSSKFSESRRISIRGFIRSTAKFSNLKL